MKYQRKLGFAPKSNGSLLWASMSLRQALAPLASRITAAFMYGSIAKKTDTAGSDIDLMLISDDVSYGELCSALENTSETLGRHVNPTILTREEFNKRLANQESFLTRVLEQRIATLEVQTQRDPMTGLYNRAYFERKLELEFARALRERSPLSLALIDIDQFKAVNDTFGHAVGDQVLITVANRLLSATRQTDTVARYGGEEFVVLLTDTGPNDARLPLERMLVAVRDTPCLIRDGARSITVTFSTGLAALTPGGTVFATPAALLEAADQMLYKVKQTERGRIGVHEPTVD